MALAVFARLNCLRVNERDRIAPVQWWLAKAFLIVCVFGGGSNVSAQQSEPSIVRPNDPLPSKATVSDPEVLERTPLEFFGGPENLEESEPSDRTPLDFIAGGPDQWTSPEGLAGSLQVMLLLTVLSLAPAILLMTTCYVRIIIVLGLLRQAIGLQSLPPSQVMTSVALFMTLFVMAPVWTRVYDDAIKPYTDPEVEMTLEEAFEKGAIPIREFMSWQIREARNEDDVVLFYGYMDPDAVVPSTFDDVPLRVLLPAFILSELKTSFLMGFQIYLPFLIVDLVVASVTISMGMLMLPPAVIALPFKLLLFVLVDGWRLVVEMLMNSFGTMG
ncbi:flagellar type III secretion system pore protein FliP [Rhodopirellula sp. P2]|uniref:flagellar type III secretion system pore protein FliP n=1 Tax=Rhodopirellula sp. P2 TaxID=2127060 RepID=UPI0023689CF3|nr:flagellar type III secretion system pore protein FliP [Rhodopirellula sp. P2]WDQ19508.1 flagellar type III secretion system pore protein FliP [Rhodopirellula sp. P2]